MLGVPLLKLKMTVGVEMVPKLKQLPLEGAVGITSRQILLLPQEVVGTHQKHL